MFEMANLKKEFTGNLGSYSDISLYLKGFDTTSEAKFLVSCESTISKKLKAFKKSGWMKKMH